MAIYVSGPNVPNPTTKPLLGAQEPYNATADSGWARTEGLITPEQLKNRFLFGIPLISWFAFFYQNTVVEMPEEEIKDRIRQGVTIAEHDLGMNIMPVQLVERHMWDRNLWLSMGYLKLRSRPIHSIEEVIVASAAVSQDDIAVGTSTGETGNAALGDAGVLYRVPLDWVDVGLLNWGQLNIVPLTTVSLSGLSQAQPTTNGGAAFLNLMAQQTWVPQFWLIRYTTGYSDGRLPRHINRYVGIVTAMDILSNIASSNALFTSMSLGIDALSQGRSGPGPMMFQQRLEDLGAERERLKAQIKNEIGRRIWSGSV